MANKKWLKDARKKMERKGTVGAFTQYCGGRVTEQCIERGLNSNNPLTRSRAQFAKNVRNMQAGGYQDPNMMMQPMQTQPIQPIAQPGLQQPGLQTGQPTGPAAEAAAADQQTEQQGASTEDKLAAGSQALSAAGNAMPAPGEGKKSVGGGALAGAGKGAAMGATLGTIVPGIGNVIGAGIGAVAGAIGGAIKANKGNKEVDGYP